MTQKPALTPLKSSAIHGYHYDPQTRRLVVEFASGGRYEHRDVPAEKVEALHGSASPGRFYADKLRGLYGATKIG
jgi:hypothetical protein